MANCKPYLRTLLDLSASFRTKSHASKYRARQDTFDVTDLGISVAITLSRRMAVLYLQAVRTLAAIDLPTATHPGSLSEVTLRSFVSTASRNI